MFLFHMNQFVCVADRRAERARLQAEADAAISAVPPTDVAARQTMLREVLVFCFAEFFCLDGG
jgi:hypothetical protein